MQPRNKGGASRDSAREYSKGEEGKGVVWDRQEINRVGYSVKEKMRIKNKEI